MDPAHWTVVAPPRHVRHVGIFHLCHPPKGFGWVADVPNGSTGADIEKLLSEHVCPQETESKVDAYARSVGLQHITPTL